ncbi:MAG TPA: hypothetical protein PK431_01095 [Chitinophagales bacterium]|nr:hypothetical protein [Chitinophagales bacterium]
MKRISLLLISIVILFAISCKKSSDSNNQNTINTDIVLGTYNGQYEYGYWAGVDSGTGDIISNIDVIVTKASSVSYKVSITNISKPFSFVITNGRKAGNDIIFDIQNQTFLLGPETIKGNNVVERNGNHANFIYTPKGLDDIPEISYGVDIIKNSIVVGYNQGFFNKN